MKCGCTQVCVVTYNLYDVTHRLDVCIHMYRHVYTYTCIHIHLYIPVYFNLLLGECLKKCINLSFLRMNGGCCGTHLVDFLLGRSNELTRKALRPWRRGSLRPSALVGGAPLLPHRGGAAPRASVSQTVPSAFPSTRCLCAWNWSNSARIASLT